MNYIEEYYKKIMSGEIVACKRIKQVYELLHDKIQNPKKYYPYIFNEDFGMHPIHFIETFCCQAEGEMGRPLELELFQKAKIQALFGFVNQHTLLRQYNESLTIEGRKNGKSTENSAIELYLTVADGEGAPQVYNLATKKEQAELCFNAAFNMIKQSPELSGIFRKRKSDIYCASNMGKIKVLSSKTNTLDGLNAHAAIIDELAAVKDRNLYDVIKQSMSSRTQPMLTCVSTNGFVRNGIFDAQYDYACKVLDGKVKDEHFLPFIYELDDREEWTDESCWIKANPGLGTIKSVEFLRNCVEKAKADESFRPTVMIKDFNMVENSAAAWLRWDELNNEELFELKDFRYGIGAFDLAETTDLAAAVVLTKRPDDENIYIIPMFFIPQGKLNQEDTNATTDNVPYRLWEKQGLLRICPGNKVNKNDILKFFLEVRDKNDIYLLHIGCDPWHVEDSLRENFDSEFGKGVLENVRQGVYTLSSPMKELKADLSSHKIIYNNNPILKWCLQNLNVKVDINGNIQPVKGMDTRQRIDGAVALIIVYVIYLKYKNDFLNLI